MQTHKQFLKTDRFKTLTSLLVGVALFFALVVPVGAIAPVSVLKKMERSWEELDKIQADLWQSVRNVVSEDVQYYAGTLYVDRYNDFRLDYHKLDSGEPLSASTALDLIHSASFTPRDIYQGKADYLWHYDRAEKTVTKQYLSQSGVPPVLLMLAGVQQFLADEFEEYYYIQAPLPEEAVQGRETYLLRFKPKGEGKEERVQYELWIDQETALPLRLRLTSPEQQMEVSFLRTKTNQKLPEKIFEIIPSPDVQFIDRTLDY